jgi:hypothetical protein
LGLWAKIHAATNIILLVIRFPVIYMKWVYKHWKAKNNFRKHLLKDGIPKHEAHELTKLYPFKISDLIQLARMNRKTSKPHFDQ